MHLDLPARKHWYYKLKREYEKEEEIKKRMEQRDAKKNFRKLMKKSQIKGMLL